MKREPGHTAVSRGSFLFREERFYGMVATDNQLFCDSFLQSRNGCGQADYFCGMSEMRPEMVLQKRAGFIEISEAERAGKRMNQSAKIEKAVEEIFSRETDFTEACREFAEAEHSYRMAKAEAFLEATGTVEERKMKADRKVNKEMKRKLAAEAALSFTKAKLDDVRQVISARQSILSASVKVWDGTKNLVP